MSMPVKNIATIETAVHNILVALGEDPLADHFIKTPYRVAKMLSEVLDGNFEDLDAFKKKMTVFEEKDYKGIVAVHGYRFYSYCAHHMAIFLGRFSLGYIPNNGRVLGLSKIIRVFRRGCKRLTTQEAITHSAVSLLSEITGSEDVICRVEAEHTCMSCRGVQAHDGLTVTEDYRGRFLTEIPLQQSFLHFATTFRNR